MEIQTGILFVSATLKDSTRLRVDEEVWKIEQSLRISKHSGHFELRKIGATRTLDLLREMLLFRPYIVHFSGHDNQERIFQRTIQVIHY